MSVNIPNDVREANQASNDIRGRVKKVTAIQETKQLKIYEKADSPSSFFIYFHWFRSLICGYFLTRLCSFPLSSATGKNLL